MRGLEGGEGEALARQLRDGGYGGPVLLLTEAAAARRISGQAVSAVGAAGAAFRASGPHGAGEDRAFKIGPYLFQPGGQAADRKRARSA